MEGHGPSEAAKIFQPAGMVLLPSLTSETAPESVKAALKRACNKVGAEGEAAIRKYLDRCQTPAESSIRSMVDEAFRNDRGMPAQTESVAATDSTSAFQRGRGGKGGARGTTSRRGRGGTRL